MNVYLGIRNYSSGFALLLMVGRESETSRRCYIERWNRTKPVYLLTKPITEHVEILSGRKLYRRTGGL